MARSGYGTRHFHASRTDRARDGAPRASQPCNEKSRAYSRGFSPFKQKTSTRDAYAGLFVAVVLRRDAAAALLAALVATAAAALKFVSAISTACFAAFCTVS